MSPFRTVQPATPAVLARVTAICTALGAQVRAARVRRRWTTERLALEAGTSRSLVYLVERGDTTTIETYARFGAALGLRFEVSLEDPRTKARPGRAEDPVHAAIVGALAARYAAQGRLVGADEPYLAQALADRHAIRGGFRSVTHVLTIAWTADCLHVLRLRGATTRSLGADAPDAFARWWDGARPVATGITSTVVVFDPVERPRAPAWAPLDDLGALRPRHRGYADLLRELRDVGRA